jgi:hypothetical protein
MFGNAVCGGPTSRTRDLLVYGVHRLPNGNTLINDQSHSRIIEVTASKQLVWRFGAVNTPGGFQVLDDGRMLSSIWGENRVVIIQRSP